MERYEKLVSLLDGQYYNVLAHAAEFVQTPEDKKFFDVALKSGDITSVEFETIQGDSQNEIGVEGEDVQVVESMDIARHFGRDRYLYGKENQQEILSKFFNK